MTSNSKMILSSIVSPKTFQPGRWLWLFVVIFLPLFISLGVWQLNRAEQKDQLEQSFLEEPLLEQDINWQSQPQLQSFYLDAQIDSRWLFLLDNKTHNGQFGYEVFVIAQSRLHHYVLSLGWVAASVEREQLPNLFVPQQLKQAKVWLRPEPINPVFAETSNGIAATHTNKWVVQGFTVDWLNELTGLNVRSVLQLEESLQYGVGENIWQPSVMSALKHRGYALQWFGMATALLIMFLYAGFKKSS